ncbi:MAG: hypothetical protein ACOCZT_01925, partial [Halanaerobiales bacterium]
MKKTDLIFALSHFCSILFSTFYNFPCISIQNKKGKIYLRAYQKGSEIKIEVEDDGSGIDSNKLVNKALEEGILSDKAAAELDGQEKLELIFHPGLSTSDEVSDVSGRGVGM